MILLYKEELQDAPSQYGIKPNDYICVSLFQGYVDYPHQPYHYILEVTVKVDDKYVVKKRTLLNEDMRNAHPRSYYIRMAIAKFDSLLEKHPTLRKQE